VWCHCASQRLAQSSSQGRLDDNFGDDNSEVVQAAIKQFPDLGTLEVTLTYELIVTDTMLTTATIIVCSVAVKLESHCSLNDACMTEVVLSFDLYRDLRQCYLHRWKRSTSCT
jgi:hypothetical protein